MTFPTLAPTQQSKQTTARRLHVAMVDEELPYPPTSGKRIRTLNLTLRLASRHRITYLCHRNANPYEDAQARKFFTQQGIATVVVDRVVPPKSGLKFYARLAANLFSPLPYSVASHDSPALRKALRDFASQNSVDLWHCEWTPYAHALRAVPGARRLVMAHNVESLIWRRYHETESNLLKRWYVGRQWRKFERFETAALREADRAVAVSPEDAALFARDLGVDNVEVVDNGVDVTYFTPGNEPRERAQILFLGSLNWRPNQDAVEQLLQLTPTVRREEPEARLVIVGRQPPEWLRRRVASVPGVELHADVSDVRPFLRRSTCLAVPLRIGGGSRLKILEALASGLPVVSTRIGAEGLHLEPGQHLDVCESPGEMTPLLIQSIRSPQRANSLAQAGREVVLQRYDWDVLAERLEQIWLDCAG